MDIEDAIKIRKYIHDERKVTSLITDLVNTIGKTTKVLSVEELNNIFVIMKRKHGVQPCKSQMRTLIEKHFPNEVKNISLLRWLIKRVMRSESGVIVYTLVTKPGDNIKFSCPEKCAYCPTETDRNGNPTQPKSYISSEPAMMRATQNGFDIGDQIKDRTKSYFYTGNIKKDSKEKKIEVILSGGTWDVMPKVYRDQVINEIYYHFNIIGEEKRLMLTLDEEKKINETSLFRVIGLTIETRPDYVTKKALLEYLEYGVTRVQLGGQSTHDDILLKIKRGCTNKNMIRAIQLLKGIGMKVVTHWMPDLPGSSPQRDYEMFEELINSPDMQTDDWKIYPCAVIKSHTEELIIKSDINEWYENGTYVPYAEKNINDLKELLINIKQKVKPWVRIERLVRDIPTQSIEVGYNKITNLRQIIKDTMTKNNLRCKCIRCMEIKDKAHLFNQGKIVVRKYEASKGIEYHITYEVEKYYWTLSYIIYCISYFLNMLIGKIIFYSGNDKMYDGLFGFLRLRIDPNPGLDLVPELVGCGLIREVHVYGISTSIGDNIAKSSQHKGIGQMLMKTAEEIIKNSNLKKTAVIAGIGAREYYKNKCGYKLDKYYMIKNL